MKKLFLLLLLCRILPLTAQEAGVKNVLGGQINFVFLKGGYYDGPGQPVQTTNLESKTRVFDFMPYAAWQVSKHALLGFRLGFSSEKEYRSDGNSVDIYEYTRKTKTYEAGIFYRHYLRPAAKFSFFFEPYIGYANTKQKQLTTNGNYSQIYSLKQASVKASPGIAYHVTERLGLLLRIGELGYSINKQQYDQSDNERRYDEFLSNFNLTSFAWGLEYRWGGKGE